MNDSTFSEQSEHKLNLRNLELSDYDHLKEVMDIVYPDMGRLGQRKNLKLNYQPSLKGKYVLKITAR